MNHHQILHIPISIGAKFQLQQAILIFWAKFPPPQKNDTYGQKTEKMNITIEYFILKLV